MRCILIYVYIYRTNKTINRRASKEEEERKKRELCVQMVVIIMKTKED